MYKECFPHKGWKVLERLKDIIAKHDAILAGGTALALQIGHRISVDLDFFTAADFRIEHVISDIRKTGLPFRIISEGDGTLILDVDGIRVSLLKYEYPFLVKYLSLRGVKIAGVPDIASMKVIAVCQRGTKRDFADLYFILQDVPFHNIARNMVSRFGKERINPVHIGKSLVYFSDAESNPEPDYIKGKDIPWDIIKIFFKKHFRQFVLDLHTAVKDTKTQP